MPGRIKQVRTRPRLDRHGIPTRCRGMLLRLLVLHLQDNPRKEAVKRRCRARETAEPRCYDCRIVPIACVYRHSQNYF